MASCCCCNEHNVIEPKSPRAIRSWDNTSSSGKNTGSASDHGTRFLGTGSDVDPVMTTTQDKNISADQAFICVICLELVDEEATALPCRHNHFHFSCLATWLQQNRSCPLCKVGVSSVRYYDRKSQSSEIFHLPNPSLPRSSQRQQSQPFHSRLRRWPHSARRSSISVADSRILQFRYHVYECQLYSLYVGNNRISRYRNITPTLFTSDPSLLPRAKKWIRRELRALDPFDQYTTSHHSSVDMSQRNQFRNNEFLLEYIVAILRHIDVKGSAGQAEVLLREHLGARHARLFLHELENWLRSPFETLNEWDAYVQYPEARHDRALP